MSTIQSIIIRPEKKGEPQHLMSAHIHANGVDGDHFVRPESRRAVTLIAADELAEVAATVGFQGDAHIACRRNICVDSFPVKNLEGQRVLIGDQVILEVIKYCTPCSRMDENFGEGAVIAFNQKAGWCAIVIEEGKINVGDAFRVL